MFVVVGVVVSNCCVLLIVAVSLFLFASVARCALLLSVDICSCFWRLLGVCCLLVFAVYCMVVLFAVVCCVYRNVPCRLLSLSYVI